jgi:hypothetical protein
MMTLLLAPAPLVQAIAKAISECEGFGVQNAIPTLANNPGDLAMPADIDWHWPGDTGERLGESIVKFDTAIDGWNQLFREVESWFNGKSEIYSRDDTVLTVAAKYTATDPETWAANFVVEMVRMNYHIGIDTTLGAMEGTNA